MTAAPPPEFAASTAFADRWLLGRDPAEARRVGDERLASAGADRRGRGEALALIGAASVLAISIDEAVSALTQAERALRRSGDAASHAVVCFDLAEALQEGRAFEQALYWVEMGSESAGRAARPVAALGSCRLATAMIGRLEVPVGSDDSTDRSALVEQAVERLNDALGVLEHGYLVPIRCEALLALGRALETGGRHREALDVVDQAGALADREGLGHIAERSHFAAVGPLIGLGRSEEARFRLDKVTMGPDQPPGSRALFAFLSGRVGQAEGDVEGAVRSLEEAAILSRRAGAPGLTFWCHAWARDAYGTMGRMQAALDHSQQLHELDRHLADREFRLTMGLWATRVERARRDTRRVSQERQAVFEASPLPMWVEDLSGMAAWVEANFREDADPSEHARMVRANLTPEAIRTKASNSLAALRYDFQHRVTGPRGMGGEGASDLVGRLAAWIWSGVPTLELELTVLDRAGVTRTVERTWRVADGDDVDYSGVVVVEIDHLAPAPDGGREMFLETLNHELRTPLTGIVGLSALLEERLDRMDTAESAQLVRMLARESRDLADMVESLMATLRLEMGEPDVRPERLTLADILDPVLTGVDVDVAMDRELVVMADPTRSRQIVRSLVSNSLRYGAPPVEVRAARGEDAYAEIVVLDHGDPMPDEDRERIFGASTDGPPPTRKTTGLGLSMAVDYAMRMGGSLTYLHDGERSIYRLRLPLAVG